MRKQAILFTLLLIALFNAAAQVSPVFEKKYYVSGTDTLPYRLLLPENFDAKKKYPLILFLHGAGERGNDNEAQLKHGSSLFVRENVRKAFPAIVIFPQCPKNSFWANLTFRNDDKGARTWDFNASREPSLGMKLLQELLYQTLKDYKIAKQQVYVTGLSMGGMGSFEIVYRNPKIFAAAIPICGGGDPAIAPAVKKVNWWVFHGDKDATVPLSNSEIMVDALKKAGAEVKFTVYPGVNHNSWDKAYAEEELLPWLFSVRK